MWWASTWAPLHAAVLSIDGKSQIQALVRRRPDRPLGPGQPAAQARDYTRHGATKLFAALDVLAGTVLSRWMQRHRNGKFIRFLNAVEAAVPPGKVLHAILDNVGSHKHLKVRAWLARQPRWAFHFTPTSASWLNAVEGFFSALTRSATTRLLHRRRRPAGGDQTLHRRAQPARQPLRLDQTRHRHPRRRQATP